MHSPSPFHTTLNQQLQFSKLTGQVRNQNPNAKTQSPIGVLEISVMDSSKNPHVIPAYIPLLNSQTIHRSILAKALKEVPVDTTEVILDLNLQVRVILNQDKLVTDVEI